MKKLITVLISIAAVSLTARNSFAAKQISGGDRYLSRGEMAVMMSATDFMKEKINNLLNFAIGYNLTSLNRLTMAPIIRFAKAAPERVPPDGRTPFNVLVSVDDPGGLTEIIAVKADISSVGRYSSMSLVDNGLWGDEKPNDGIFTLQTSTNQKIKPGEKEISVSVVNKKGWLAVAKTNVTVDNLPTIISAGALPSTIVADGHSTVKFSARISDPGGLENISSVLIDLSLIGGPPNAQMRNDGLGGDATPADNIYSFDFIPTTGVGSGKKELTILVNNRTGSTARGIITLNIVK
jgi:hypothetical protein